ncbi:hypothetical protein BTO16_11545 [Polaribacter glomeratus]|uniref:Uncharacterized protein n=2 Tax=Polaribacter glomeratus TaxID=102 RepID=A0A2S7WGZ7_9FLAO|nr:hypothetical protein BTO16_11545 [Polaribacter glomeratus]
MNPPIPKLETLTIENKFQKQELSEQSFYELTKEYRDPFLGGFPKKKRVTKKKAPQKIEPTITFPNVVYNGVIGGSQTKSYILTVNGKQEILNKGETLQGVKLVKANSEEIVVTFEKVTKTITKQ